MNWIQETLNNFELLTVGLVQANYQALAIGLLPAVKVAIVLYFSIIGIGVIKGHIEMPSGELLTRAIKAGIIFTFFTSWDTFSTYTSYLAFDFANDVGIQLINGMNSVRSTGVTDITGQGMGDIMMTIWDRAGAIVSTASDKSFVWGIVISIFVGGTAAFLVAISFGLLIFTKASLALLLGLTPLFLLMLFFDGLKGIFEGWLRALLMTILLPILVYAVIAFVFYIVDPASVTTTKLLKTGFRFSSFGPLIISYLTGIILMWQVKDMAYGISGGYRSIAQAGFKGALDLGAKAINGMSASFGGKQREIRKSAARQIEMAKERKRQLDKK